MRLACTYCLISQSNTPQLLALSLPSFFRPSNIIARCPAIFQRGPVPGKPLCPPCTPPRAKQSHFRVSTPRTPIRMPTTPLRRRCRTVRMPLHPLADTYDVYPRALGHQSFPRGSQLQLVVSHQPSFLASPLPNLPPHRRPTMWCPVRYPTKTTLQHQILLVQKNLRNQLRRPLLPMATISPHPIPSVIRRSSGSLHSGNTSLRLWASS